VAVCGTAIMHISIGALLAQLKSGIKKAGKEASLPATSHPNTLS